MKWFAIILTLYLSLLTVTPSLCLSYTTISQVNTCCNETECSQNADDCNKTDENECTPCCLIQTCCCNIVPVPEFNFMIQHTITGEKTPAKNDKTLSDYLSECWHPPELIVPSC